jgi:hypothetical protein
MYVHVHMCMGRHTVYVQGHLSVCAWMCVCVIVCAHTKTDLSLCTLSLQLSPVVAVPSLTSPTPRSGAVVWCLPSHYLHFQTILSPSPLKPCRSISLVTDSPVHHFLCYRLLWIPSSLLFIWWFLPPGLQPFSTFLILPHLNI